MIMDYRMSTLFLSIKISLVIAIMNAILEEIIIYFVAKLGIDTYSRTVTVTKYILFIMYFFNSNIVILLMAAKFDNPLLSMFHGKYTDFTSEWYIVIGSQYMCNQIVDSFMPAVGYWISTLVQRLEMSYDQGRLGCIYCCLKELPDETQTKCNSVYEYLELYSGPKYEISAKFAISASNILTAFMLGPAIPILFPYALIQTIFQYIVEKYAIAYFHRQPINYNQQLNDDQVYLLLMSPVLYSAMGFWFYTNQ